MKYLKFEFTDREDMLTELAAYHETIEDELVWKDCAVHELKYIEKVPAEYDAEGNITKAAVLSTKYSVDVLFYGQHLESAKERIVNSGGKKIKVKKPINEKEYEIIEIEGVGVHTFGGLEYLYEERRKEK